MRHFDTVWPVDNLKKRQVGFDSNRRTGPGIHDMKSGIGLFIQAIDYMRRANTPSLLPICMLSIIVSYKVKKLFPDIQSKKRFLDR